MNITLICRDSRLSLAQARPVASKLEEISAIDRVNLITTKSDGDLNRDKSLHTLDEPGFFTRKLDRMVAAGEADAAVHSLKDCPASLPEPLVIAAILKRRAAGDLLVAPQNSSQIPSIQPGLVVGTGSSRRRANLLYHEPDLKLLSCRGNVPTRLAKLNDNKTDYDCLVLAAAGLQRLNIDDFPTLTIPREILLPAPGQGAVALVCNRKNRKIRRWLEKINDPCTAVVCRAERALLKELGGGCQIPVGAVGKLQKNQLHLAGSLTDPTGEKKLTGELTDEPENAEDIGLRLAKQLLARGGEEIMTNAG